MESKKPTHFSIVTNDRPYNFATTGDAGNFSSVSVIFEEIFFLSLDIKVNFDLFYCYIFTECRCDFNRFSIGYKTNISNSSFKVYYKEGKQKIGFNFYVLE